MDKDKIVCEIAAIMEQYYAPPLGARCLYWSYQLVLRLAKEGVRGLIQAGDAMWPRVRPEQDDGVSPTHFSYVWDKHEAMDKILRGIFPEIHVWVGIPESQTIIDLTTKYWPERCQQLIGCDWPGDKPPDYLWVHGDELPNGVIYNPKVDATLFAMHHVADHHRSNPWLKR